MSTYPAEANGTDGSIYGISNYIRVCVPRRKVSMELRMVPVSDTRHDDFFKIIEDPIETFGFYWSVFWAKEMRWGLDN